MKKRIYRIELKKISGLQQELAVMAALSNGGNYISLQDMDAIARTDLKRYPYLNTDISVNLIGDSCLTIDKGTENLLVLTEVEILELIDEDAPTLSRYGITDENNMELIN